MGVVKDVYDTVKDIVKTAKTLGNDELAIKAINMYEKVIDMKKEMDEMEELIKSFENKKEIEKRIIRSQGLIADYTDENGVKMKICITCWDKDKKIIQVGNCYDDSGSKKPFVYYCPVCKEVFSYDDNKE